MWQSTQFSGATFGSWALVSDLLAKKYTKEPENIFNIQTNIHNCAQIRTDLGLVLLLAYLAETGPLAGHSLFWSGCCVHCCSPEGSLALLQSAACPLYHPWQEGETRSQHAKRPKCPYTGLQCTLVGNSSHYLEGSRTQTCRLDR